MNRLLPVPDASHANAARREVESVARTCGFSEQDIGRAALVALEMATNVARHGGGGHLLLREVSAEDRKGLELISIDRGPGMADIAHSMSDGVSTYGSAGVGLGAIRRQADEFDIHSQTGPEPGHGTAIYVRLWPGRRAPVEKLAVVGSVSVPKPEELVCGDGVSVVRSGSVVSLLVVDGLGHGVAAQQAANAACELFQKGLVASPVMAVQRIHAGLRGTRGAAIGVANVDLVASSLTFSGLGNIAGLAAAGGQVRRFVSMNGIAGHTAGQLREFVYPCDGQGLVVILHSDGIGTSWSLDRYPGLAARHPALIAAVLYRDGTRGRDDATVLVLRRAP
ncbi:MAG: anti-sigma regulatory factor [Reyranella sp.]|uniref:ATP-binding SpoIIE family protein phosphatase n=1 Tax=Reyranella sp. TaxID=1929291 RepID=UPI0011F97140|nr:ATP-binding SpoIIE family protein phosphatase [Reyranella sp.]TAJ97093.1 MAG: anti-sigma regulatory factor [Reyranella sp.]